MNGKCAGCVSPRNPTRRVDAGKNTSLPLRQKHIEREDRCAPIFSAVDRRVHCTIHCNGSPRALSSCPEPFRVSRHLCPSHARPVSSTTPPPPQTSPSPPPQRQPL